MAKYSKQTYEMVAGIIKQQVDLANFLKSVEHSNGMRYAALNIAENLADNFDWDNPNFKRNLFMKACGYVS